MKKYEYKTIQYDSETLSSSNELGLEGWKMFAVDRKNENKVFYFFRRRIK
jgi:hypothetical protein